VKVDEEHNVDDGAERLSAGAFLARCESFRYIETRSETKMSDIETIVRVGREINGRNPSAPRFDSMNRTSQSIFSCAIRLPEHAILKIKSPNSVIRTRSNFMKTNARDMLKSPKNQKSDPRSFDLFPPRSTAILISFPAFLTGSGLQTEIDVTCSKQTTKKFLTGARTHIRETRICAKMGAQISSKLSAQMSGIR
jgi:hypothetical protein